MKPTPVAKPAVPSPSVTQALDALEAEAKKQTGSPSFNPFLWIKKNITPLRAAIKANEPDVAARVAALKVPAPKK